MKTRSMGKTLKMRGMRMVHFAVTVAMFALCWIRFFIMRYTEEGYFHPKGDVLTFVVYSLTFFMLMRNYDIYNIGYAGVGDTIYSQTMANVVSNGVIYILSLLMYMRPTSPLPLMALCVFQLIWNTLWSVCAGHLYRKIHAHKRTVVIYKTADDLHRLKEIRHLKAKFKIEKYIENPGSDYKSLERELDGFEAILVSGVDATLRNGIAKYCIEKGVLGYFAPHVGDVILQGARHMRTFSVPIFSVRRAEPTPEYLFMKRALDILFSAVALVLLSPIYLIAAIAIKAHDGGPVLYRQVRLTKDGRQFKILKFRSMRVDAEKDGVARLASENDDRITPVGRIIRACRVDEIPQLINILKGDMSIVGPRPERPEIARQYEEFMPAFSLRLQVKAGLTGFAQVYGKYNTSPYDKLQMDLMYINKMNLVEDFRLAFATVRILFLKNSTEGVTIEPLPRDGEDQEIHIA